MIGRPDGSSLRKVAPNRRPAAVVEKSPNPPTCTDCNLVGAESKIKISSKDVRVLATAIIVKFDVACCRGGGGIDFLSVPEDIFDGLIDDVVRRRKGE